MPSGRAFKSLMQGMPGSQDVIFVLEQARALTRPQPWGRNGLIQLTLACIVLSGFSGFKCYCFFKQKNWASLVVQWLRICLLMQRTRVRALVWEDPTCHGATRPVSHNC